MRDIRYYLSLPWHIQRTEHDDDGNYVALTIEELPGFVVASESIPELEAMFWPALEAFLQTYLDDGTEPPLPARVREREERLARIRSLPRLHMSADGPGLEAEAWSVGWDETVSTHPGHEPLQTT